MIFRSFFRPRRPRAVRPAAEPSAVCRLRAWQRMLPQGVRPAGFGLPPGKAASPLQFPCEAAGRLPSRPRPCWKLASSALSHSETGGPPHFSSAPSSRSLSCQSSNSAPISCANSRSVCVSSFFSSSSTSKAKLPEPYLFHAAAAAGSGQEPTDTENAKRFCEPRRSVEPCSQLFRAASQRMRNHPSHDGTAAVGILPFLSGRTHGLFPPFILRSELL